MNLRVLPPAQEEAREAGEWYESQQPGIGAQFNDALESVLTEIEASPLRFPKDLSAPSRPDARRAKFDGFPHSVIYEIHESEIIVLAIMHPSRRPAYWRRRG
ncbi:MAG: type II toxin-antitoxin system RelE/ParE family toxin [Planctomycetes bacterium]|nr:type II toxin-antitoxin system RelE/ParE family toxin [Planctomycetota bacterium]